MIMCFVFILFQVIGCEYSTKHSLIQTHREKQVEISMFVRMSTGATQSKRRNFSKTPHAKNENGHLSILYGGKSITRKDGKMEKKSNRKLRTSEINNNNRHCVEKVCALFIMRDVASTRCRDGQFAAKTKLLIKLVDHYYADGICFRCGRMFTTLLHGAIAGGWRGWRWHG